MQTDKSATILEAQWMEKEIPRIEEELNGLIKMEQELLTTPLKTVSQTYTTVYRAERRRAHPFYHRRRSVTPTRYGYRERMLDIGWFAIIARLLITAVVVLAVYVFYRNHQSGHIQRGVVSSSVALVIAIGLSFAPITADQLWERYARKRAEAAAERARQSEAFLRERQDRQAKLKRCRARIAELQERLKFAHVRLDELRRELTSSNHQGKTPQ